MKQFMIRYRRANTDAEAWHRDIATFIAAIDSDAPLFRLCRTSFT